MKRLILLVMSLFIATNLMAQMNFETGTWAEVKAKAKKEKKMIFIDFYTQWCGPCKIMAKNTFPLPIVGDYYNKNFINYKIDAEKGEGLVLAKQFEVKSYPTYLYIDSSEKLFYRSGGSMPAEKFINEGKMAISLFSDKKGMEQWDKEYIKKKNDPKFVLEYMVKRSMLKLDNADLADQYVTICNGNNELLFNKDFLKTLYGNNTCINAGGVCFNFVTENIDKVVEILETKKEMYLYNLPFLTTLYSVKKAAENKNEAMFQRTIEANKKIMELTSAENKLSEYHILCYYFYKTKQDKRLDEVAEGYARDLLDEMIKAGTKDKEDFAKYLQSISEDPSSLKGKSIDELVMTITFKQHSSSTSISFKYRDLALWVSMTSNNATLKNKAIEWALLSYKLFDNFSNTEAVAEAYYQAGRYEEAKLWIKLTKDKIPAMANEEILNRVDERIERMNKK